jgi:hypothetical protein
VGGSKFVGLMGGGIKVCRSDGGIKVCRSDGGGSKFVGQRLGMVVVGSKFVGQYLNVVWWGGGQSLQSSDLVC